MLPTIEQLEKALDSIRPYLHTDGGDVRVIDINAQGLVRVELLGNCMNCKISNMTLKAGVEQTLIQQVPGVSAVIAIDSQESLLKI